VKSQIVKGLAFRIHGLAEKLENLPVVKRAAHRHFVFDNGGFDATMAATTTTTAAMTATTAGL
jgi:hypothetical protein